MSERSMAPLLLTVALAGYGLYAASLAYGMLLGHPSLLLLIGFVLQAICAFAAAVGVWRGASWAATPVILLGLAVAATWLVEGLILGIVGYLYAILVAVLAVLLALLLAVYLGRRVAPGGGASA